MDKDMAAQWLELGEQLRNLDADKYEEVVSGLQDLLEAQRIIARFDWQLMFRGRPGKRYSA